MSRYTRIYPSQAPSLGPALVIRGALIMTFIMLLGFSKLANGVAFAEYDQASQLTIERTELSNDPTPTPSKARTTGPSCKVSQAFPEQVRQWCELITEYAKANDLPPDLIAALIWQESGGNSDAYSHSGAVGLMQVMPRDGIAASFMCQNGPCFASRPTIAELENPDFNIAYGTRMLAGLYQRFGDLRQALKAYGPMDVGYSYADTVLGLYENYHGE